MIDRVGLIMTEGAKDKIMVLTQAVTNSVEAGIRDVTGEDERIGVIRKLVTGIRFQEDQSGYIFVYQGTTNRIMPAKPGP